MKSSLAKMSATILFDGMLGLAMFNDLTTNEPSNIIQPLA